MKKSRFTEAQITALSCCRFRGRGVMIDPHELDPDVLAVWLAVDISEMTLAQLDQLDENLKRLTV